MFCWPLLSAKLPTAQTSLDEMARTSSSTLPAGPGLGLITSSQPMPFQCSVMVSSAPRLRSKPTAQTSHGEISVTPVKVLSVVLGTNGVPPVRLTQGAAVAADAGASSVIPPTSSGAANASGAASPMANRTACDREYRTVDPFLGLSGAVVSSSGWPLSAPCPGRRH